MNRDNDIIKALGFVTLYSAYVEESIDILIDKLSFVEKVKSKKNKWSVSRKIKWCIDTIKSFKNENLIGLVNLLKDTKKILRKRNDVVHGRVYPGNDRNYILKSARKEVDRNVSPDELYDLAEDLFELQKAIPYFSMFETMKAIEKVIDS